MLAGVATPARALTGMPLPMSGSWTLAAELLREGLGIPMPCAYS